MSSEARKPRQSAARARGANGRRIVYVLVSLILTGVVLAMFIAGPGINCSDKAKFGDMVYGRASRPFVYRALLPGTIPAVSSVVPSRARDFVEFHLIDHNLVVLRSFSLSTPLLWLGVGLLVFFRWSEKPAFLKRGIWILAVLLAFSFFLGYIDELRGYYEALPVLLLLVAQSVAAAFGVEVTPLAGSPGGEARTSATA